MPDSPASPAALSRFARAQRVIPGGVNSPVRAFKSVGGTPPFIARAKGPFLFDEDGKSYTDFVCSWGAVLLGHADEGVSRVIAEAAGRGLSYGAPTVKEIEMAEKICTMVPSAEMVRMVNSGTEATMSALRLARARKGRDEIVKFTGCYHGHSDALLAGAGSGLLTLSIASSPGVPAAMIKNTHNLPFNNCQTLREYFARLGDKTAAVILEPMAGNMNFVPADAEFLHCARELCDKHGSLLIFDEVMTGFRVARGGAQSHYKVMPDLTCWGKVIGGGLPIGAFGGREEIMRNLAPEGKVYQAGTLAGNPAVMAVGLHILERLDDDAFYADLHERTAGFAKRLTGAAEKAGVGVSVRAHGGMLGFYCGNSEFPRNFEEVSALDVRLFAKIFHLLLERGIHMPPSAYEAFFVSAAHTNEVLEEAAETFAAVFELLSPKN